MDYSWILMLVLMFGILYFFMIRPENKRKKEAENLRNSLAVGDEITTIGGMTGTVCAVKENMGSLATSTKIRFGAPPIIFVISLTIFIVCQIGRFTAGDT